MKVLSPQRLQASFFWSREDAARFAGMETALRQNLSDALSSKLDSQVLNHSSKGLLSGGIAEPNAPGAAYTYANYLGLITSQVDGRYANLESDVRLLIGSDTLTHMHTVNQAQSGESAASAVRRLGGGLRVSNQVPAKSGTTQASLAARAINAQHAVAPLWEGISLIRDEITLVGKGQIQLTAVMLYAFDILRSAGFARLRPRLS